MTTSGSPWLVDGQMRSVVTLRFLHDAPSPLTAPEAVNIISLNAHVLPPYRTQERDVMLTVL